MPIWSLLDRVIQNQSDKKAIEAEKAANAVKEEIISPEYTPQELQEIKELFSEPVQEKEIDVTTVSRQIDGYIDSCSKEKLKKFAYYLLKPSFDLSKERAMQLAEVVSQNKEYLKGKFYHFDVRNNVRDRLNQQKTGRERNVAWVLLSEPHRYASNVFNNFNKRSTGDVPFLTSEEFERVNMKRRRSGP